MHKFTELSNERQTHHLEHTLGGFYGHGGHHGHRHGVRRPEIVNVSGNTLDAQAMAQLGLVNAGVQTQAHS